MVTLTRPAPARTRKPVSVGRILAWAYVVVILLVTIFPFYWMLRTALSNNYSLSTDPSSFFPVDFTFGAFKRALGLASPGKPRRRAGPGRRLA